MPSNPSILTRQKVQFNSTNESFARAGGAYNGLGQLAAAGQLSGTVNVLDFSNQAAGQYMLQLRNETDVQSVKLIIE